MKTKQQKIQDVKEGGELVGNSKALVFVDFSKTPANEMNRLRAALATANSSMKVLKKTLLGIILKEKGINVDATQLAGPVGTIFSPAEISESAGIVARFKKGNEGALAEFKMLAGYDMATSRFYDAVQIVQVGNLPPREVLLAQLVGMIAAPVRSLLYALNQVSEKGGAQPAATQATESVE